MAWGPQIAGGERGWPSLEPHSPGRGSGRQRRGTGELSRAAPRHLPAEPGECSGARVPPTGHPTLTRACLGFLWSGGLGGAGAKSKVNGGAGGGVHNLLPPVPPGPTTPSQRSPLPQLSCRLAGEQKRVDCTRHREPCGFVWDNRPHRLVGLITHEIVKQRLCYPARGWGAAQTQVVRHLWT